MLTDSLSFEIFNIITFACSFYILMLVLFMKQLGLCYVVQNKAGKLLNIFKIDKYSIVLFIFINHA